MKTGAKRKQLMKIWMRDGGICWICKEPVTFLEASRDHVVPRSKGGRGHVGNLKTAHKLCNSRRGNGDSPPYPILLKKKTTRAAKAAGINPETMLEFVAAEARARTQAGTAGMIRAVRVERRKQGEKSTERKVLGYLTNDNTRGWMELTEDEKIAMQKRDEG